jgi:lactoylglutathione lyase
MKSKFTYTGIRVKDLEASVAFYTKVLGMRERGRGEIPATKGITVDLVTEEGGANLELNYYKAGSRFATPYAAGEGLDHLAFRVDDLDKALAEANRAGHPTALDMKTESSRYAYIQDPNGIWIELFT